ncbi:MAG: hypothetical protein Q9184_007696, partial [Pyrenodesmia sp. 2 TL-2023]
MSLLDLLRDAYDNQSNYKNQNFISYYNVGTILTKDRIDEWTKSHPLCLEHGQQCLQTPQLIDYILGPYRLVFAVLVFAKLEFLLKKLVACECRDIKLFDTGSFKRVCDAAGLSDVQEQKLIWARTFFGVIFAHDSSQDVPKDAVLPFVKREDLDRFGSFGVLYRITIPCLQLSIRGTPLSNDNIVVAEKRIRPTSSPAQGDWGKLFREVQTLRKRGDHPNIIPLLASYTLDTVESGHQVKTLHLLLQIAEMDLADWMTKTQIPPPAASLSVEERQAYLFHHIYALVSSISHLHREVDGIVTSHHDLKPRNILIVGGILKITDFGHAHLLPIIEGSATEGTAGLGTYEYQPPEYWKQDGSRAQIKHGRAFDVWAVGCIIIELAILFVHGWQSAMIKKFRTEREQNAKRDRKTPDSVGAESDNSFHNNTIVLTEWLNRLRDCGANQQLTEILNIVTGMLNSDPCDRPFMWEIQMDLYEILKHDKRIPVLQGDLCVRPPSCTCTNPWHKRHIPNGSIICVRDGTETPLHRAARKNYRERTIRLWELGWPILLPDVSGMTPRDIIRQSDDLEIRSLYRDVTAMLEAAGSGNLGEMRKLFNKGLSPLMVDAQGRTALCEAIISLQTDVVHYLLEVHAQEQAYWWDMRTNMRTPYELPLHKAAKLGFTECLKLIVPYYADVNIIGRGYGTPLTFAAEGNHIDAVRFLLEHGAQVAPPKARTAVETPLHAAAKRNRDGEILKLLLEADDGHE